LAGVCSSMRGLTGCASPPLLSPARVNRTRKRGPYVNSGRGVVRSRPARHTGPVLPGFLVALVMFVALYVAAAIFFDFVLLFADWVRGA
jgi:hypothetical protein